MIESELATYLIVTTRATYAKAAARVYPTRKPPKALSPATFPMVTFSKVSGAVDHTLDGVTGLGFPRFQFNCWAATYKAAHELAEAVKSDLDNFRGTMGTVRVDGILLEDESEVSDPRLGVDVDTPFGVRLDFRIIHTR